MIKTARILFYTVSFMLVLTGIVYVFNPKLMRYHYHFLGVTPEQIDQRVFILFQTAKQITGGCMLGIGAALAIMTKNMHIRPELHLPAMAALTTVSLLVSLYAVLRAGETFPIALVAACMIMLAAGFLMLWLGRSEFFGRSEES